MSSIGYMYGEDVARHMALIEMQRLEEELDKLAALAGYIDLHGAA